MVEIKKLEWREADGGNVCLIATARTPFGSYFIESDAEGFVLTLNHIGLLPHPTFAAAKAAAQQDYETRILSALVNAQADADVVERLTRPIVGIENRTALETFDIMADRIRAALSSLRPAEVGSATGTKGAVE